MAGAEEGGEWSPATKGPMLAEMEYLLASEDLKAAMDRGFELAWREAKRLADEMTDEDVISMLKGFGLKEIDDESASKLREWAFKSIFNSFCWELFHHIFLMGRKGRKGFPREDEISEKG